MHFRINYMACFQLYFMGDLSLLEEIKENAMDDAVSQYL